jgi:hypothetical protein
VLVVPAEVPVPAGERRVLRESLVGLTLDDLRDALRTGSGSDHRTRAVAR